jgi:hypothetical protein
MKNLQLKRIQRQWTALLIYIFKPQMCPDSINSYSSRAHYSFPKGGEPNSNAKGVTWPGLVHYRGLMEHIARIAFMDSETLSFLDKSPNEEPDNRRRCRR